MEYSKINGIYSFYEHENGKAKKMYCYIAIDKNGKKVVKYTEDENLINKLLMKYIADKGYSKSNFQKLLSEDSNIKVGANTAPNINIMTDNIKDEDDYIDAFSGYYDYKNNKDKKEDKEKKAENNSLHSEEEKKDNLITRIKKSLTKKNIKKWAFRLAPAAIAIALVAGGFKLFKDNSPTKSGSLIATVQDPLDLEETKELPEKEEAAATETKTSNSNETTSRNREISSSSSRGSSKASIKPTKEAGSINKDYENLNYQKPATLPEKEEPSKEPQEDEKYDNVIIEEGPVTDNTNDEEYDQVIEVGGDNNDNVNLEVPEDAIEEGSIKNESETEAKEVNEDIAGTNAEVESSENTNTNESQTAETIEEVPVTQEEEITEASSKEKEPAPPTQSTSNEGQKASTEAAAPKEKEQPATTSSTSSSSTSNTEFKIDADAIGAAVERMGNGENIDVIIDSNGNVTTVPVEESSNSLSK